MPEIHRFVMLPKMVSANNALAVAQESRFSIMLQRREIRELARDERSV
jgi:hypothetical protein